MNATHLKKLPAHFYQTQAGAVPVLDWLRGLDPADRKTVGGDVAAGEFGWPVGMPVCRSLGGGLWEVRSTIRSGRVEARVIFAIGEGHMILLHAFEKKTQQAPDQEVKTAQSRWADYQRRMRK